MRIAIVHEKWGAGAARCAQDLRRGLENNHEIYYFPEKAEVLTTVDVMDELARFRPDVVHCHSFYGNLSYNFLATASARYPTCFTVHDPSPIGTMHTECWACEKNTTCRRCPLVRSGWRQFLRNPYYVERREKRATHQRCAGDTQFIAPSLWMLERLRDQELCRFDLQHIPYGIDLDHFKRMPDTRESFGLPKDRSVILFSAWYESKRSIGERKGLADLAEAFISKVLPEVPGAILAVAGESFVPNHPSVYPLGLVTFDRLPQLFSAADVYVLPTLADNLPYTVIEAMGCGVPVIATDVGGIPEQIVQGETGFLVPPAQSFELGAAIVKMLMNPERARIMGSNGRRRAQAIYSMKPFVDAYEQLYWKLRSSRL
jgi:glycosyltransferase involved in cell wall biosynthesis